MVYNEALKLAKNYKRLLEPVCDQIMIVGSVRRADEKAMTKGVHDIEILLIPKLQIATDLLGYPLPESDQPPSQLDLLLEELKQAGALAEPRIARKADGPRYKKFAIPGHNYYDQVERKTKEFCLELWIVNEKTWGIQAVIRTGPAEFSYAFVNSENYIGYHKASGKHLRGLLPHYYEYIAGRTEIIVRGTRNAEHPESEQVIDLPTEQDAIRLLGLNSLNDYWIEPSERINYVKEVK